jgi:GTP-binding protein
VDTAGLRKKKKVEENLEFYSVMRAIRAIENSDVCILMCDASEGFDAQDISIFSLAARNRKGVVVVMNKWDLVEKDHKTHKEYEELVKKR